MAAKHTTDKDVLEYVVKNAKINLFERNANGDTALTISRDLKNDAAAKVIEDCQELFDDSGKATEDLMNEILGEEEKNDRARQRKKEKKKHSKLQKLADKHNCTIEQLEEVFKK